MEARGQLQVSEGLDRDVVRVSGAQARHVVGRIRGLVPIQNLDDARCLLINRDLRRNGKLLERPVQRVGEGRATVVALHHPRIKSPLAKAAKRQAVAGKEVGISAGPRPGVGSPGTDVVLERDDVGMLAAPRKQVGYGVSNRRPGEIPWIAARIIRLVQAPVYRRESLGIQTPSRHSAIEAGSEVTLVSRLRIPTVTVG